MKYVLVFALLFLFGGFSISPTKTKIRVLIDAGHGGNDPGHLSHNMSLKSEKELNLLIANKLGGYIEQYLGNVEVLYTRKDDRFYSLDERVNAANNNNVDYFMSVHCNGNPKRTVHGTESHVHNFQAKKSYLLAKDIEKQFSTRAGRYSRGVKNTDDRAHSIQVLKFTRMTSVLVECGFLTNEREANYLNTNYGQEIIASAIFRGFRTAIKRDFPTLNIEKSNNQTATTTSRAYSLQIMSSIDPIDTEHESFKRIGIPVKRIKMNTTNAYKYKYLAGAFTTKAEAQSQLSLVKKKGFPDAIVVRN